MRGMCTKGCVQEVKLPLMTVLQALTIQLPVSFLLSITKVEKRTLSTQDILRHCQDI